MENLIELRSLRKHHRGYMQYVFSLQKRGAIGSYLSKDGYAAFLPSEVAAYQQTARRGRPRIRKYIEKGNENE